MDSCCIIIFAKAPVAGFAKTRLIPALGEQGAADLAQRLLEHAVKQAWMAAPGDVELCVTPHHEHPAFAALTEAHGVRLSVQGDGDLGERMHRAFERSLQVHHRVILIGTDAPALDAQMLRSALESLHTHDAVFVPAHDGGYALVGLRKPCPELFHEVPWSTASVMQETRHRALGVGLHWLEMPAVHDIDDPQDLVHIPEQWNFTALPS